MRRSKNRRGVLPRLCFFLLGGAAVAVILWQLVAYRPFEPHPPLAPAARSRSEPGGGHLYQAVEPEQPVPSLMRFGAEPAATPPLSDTTNLLLAGIDTRRAHADGRTDALILLVVDEPRAGAGIVSVPRDLLVDLPGYPPARINTVYRRGTREGGAALGAAWLKQVVRDVFALEVHHLVFINYAGFEALIDALEGISVNVICPIRDRFIDPRGQGGRLELDLDPGPRWMDGRTALMYARSRHGRGVRDRARRQHAVLVALRERVRELGLGRLPEVIAGLGETIFTDMALGEISRLARRLLAMEPGRLHGLVLGRRHAPQRVLPDGRWVMVPDRAEIQAALGQLFAAGTPGFRPPESCPAKDVAVEGR
jgi:LCP family protein required for cell wall assembly